MRLLAKIWNFVFIAYMAISGIIKKYIIPALSILNVIKHFAFNYDQDDPDGNLTDELIKAAIKSVFPASASSLLLYMNAFVQAVLLLLPAEIFTDVNRKSFYDVARATIKYLRSLPNKYIIYAYLLQIATQMFVSLYGKKLSTTEAAFITQLSYTYAKRKKILKPVSA